MKVGIFGGSFNPVHIGHTALASYICEQGLVDEVWMLVSPQNPLKRNLELLDENERFKMVCLAVAPYPQLKACDFEFHLPRTSYTYHTLQALRKAYPLHEFSLIIGEDNWEHFDRWYRNEEIARETSIIVYPRDTQSGKLIVKEKGCPTASYTSSDKSFPLLPFSSTEIRQLIAEGESAAHMLHPDVADYIKRNDLYTKATEK